MEPSDKARRLAAILDASRKLVSTVDLDELLSSIIGVCSGILDADSGSLMLIDKNTGKLVIRASTGLDEEIIQKTALEIGEGVAGWVTKNNKPMLIINGLDRYPMFRHLKVKKQIKSAISVPLRSRDKVIGVLNLEILTKRQNFTEADLELAISLADIVAISVDNAYRFSKLRKSREMLDHRAAELTSELDIKLKDEELARRDLSNFRSALLNILEDIATARDETEKAKTYVDNIIGSLVDTLIVVDSDGRIKTVNRATCDLLGYGEKNLIGQPVGMIFAKEEEEEEEEEIIFKGTRLEKLIKEGFIRHYEMTYLTGGGEAIPVSFSGSVMKEVDCPHKGPSANCPVFKEKGIHCDKIVGIVGIARDMREYKHLQERLMNSERLAAVGELAASVAHEINNPLSILSGYAQYLIRYMPADDPRREDLEIICKQAERCSRITQSLLRFAWQPQPEFKEMDINEVLDDSLKMLEKRLTAEKIEISKDLEDSLIKIMGDEDLLSQVFVNIILNAQEAMPVGGRLTIETHGEKVTDRGGEADVFKPGTEIVAIEISDNGRGIAPEEIGHIFEPFYTKRKGGEGTGLGLAVSYGIIKSHGGLIDVESEPGVGTKFTIRLPVKQPRGGEEVL